MREFGGQEVHEMQCFCTVSWPHSLEKLVPKSGVVRKIGCSRCPQNLHHAVARERLGSQNPDGGPPWPTVSRAEASRRPRGDSFEIARFWKFPAWLAPKPMYLHERVRRAHSRGDIGNLLKYAKISPLELAPQNWLTYVNIC